MNKDIKNIFKKRLAERGILSQAQAAEVCDAARKVMGGECRVVSFTGGTLKLSAPDSAKAHLLRLKQQQIIDDVNKELGEDKIKKIRFSIRG